MLLSRLPLVALASLTLLLSVRALPFSTNRDRAQHPVPPVGGSSEAGWESMPSLEDADAHSEWDVGGASIPVYLSAQQDTSKIRRAVIINSGLHRDCWSSWTYANNALYASSVDRSTISILSPCWFTQKDLQAGAAPPNSLTFPADEWMSGADSTSDGGFSTFRALDALASYYLDRTAFPNLDTLTIAGHSAGGQLTQRYALLRPSSTARMQFWVANPASFAWLTPERPVPPPAAASCEGVDEYKYGLGGTFPGYVAADAGALGRAGLVARYLARSVRYAFGSADHAVGDAGCEAEAQGADHLARGGNFVEMVRGLGGSPSVAFVEGVGHSDEGMIGSASAIDTFFGQ